MQANSGNIILIGMPGSGKSTCGVVAAKLLLKNFFDTDLLIQNREGQRLQQIIDEKGLDYFARAEEEAVLSLDIAGTVIATGGGIVLAEGNRQFMRENGVVIYLQASVSALIDRLEAYPKAEQRPTLTGKPVREEVGEVLAQREALYRDAAHHIVDATASPDRVGEQTMSVVCDATATPVS